MRTSKWIGKNMPSLKGRTVAISGATGGLGRALCEHVARLGGSLVLIDRNPQKSEALERALCEAVSTVRVTRVIADMEDLDSVKAAAEQLARLPIDALVLNAGAYSIPRHRCSTGYDNVFQINFLSPYYLASRLLPQLRARGGRIVAVSSIAHRYSESDPADIDFSTRTRASLVYGNSKRYLTCALSALDGGGGVVTVHPGISFTNITAHYPRLLFALIKYPMKLIFPSPRRASLSLLWGLVAPCGEREWIGPRCFDVWGLPARRRLRGISEEERARICRDAARMLETLVECDGDWKTHTE